MAAQNVTGMTVPGPYGDRPRLPTALAGTGAATVATAPFGGHAPLRRPGDPRGVVA